MEEILKSLPEPMQLNESVYILIALVLVLIFILNSMIFKPLMAVMEERQRKIKEGEEARSKSLQTVEESQKAYNQGLLEARRSAQQKRNQMLKESEMIRSEIIAKTREDAMAMIQAKATELDEQVKNAKQSLKQETSEIAEQIVAAILSKASSR